jgi:PAS domain S-box-containing protein
MTKDTKTKDQLLVSLRESEEKFKNLAEQSPSMIFINNNGKVVYVNKKCEEVMGYKKEEFYSPDFSWHTLIAPEYMNIMMANYKEHMRGKDVPPVEYELITKEGKRFDAILSTKLINYEGKQAILGTATDITERIQAEKVLRESEERFKTLFVNAPLAYQSLDETSKILDVNQAWLSSLGYSYEEVINHHFTEFIAPEYFEYFAKCFPDFKIKGRVDNIEFQMVCKDGKSILVSFFGSVQRSPSGTFQRTHCIFEDITERKKIEEKLLRSEKELKKRVKELEEFYDMAVGRELRMKELKEENKALKEELEQYKNQ